MKAILLCEKQELVFEVYNDKALDELLKFGLDKKIYTKEDILNGDFSDTKYIFSTWGMPSFTEEEIKSCFPNLKCIFYAAGTVQGFAKEFINCGVKVFSGWAANAVPVAEFTAAQIILANKGYFISSSLLKKKGYAKAREHFNNYKGNFDLNVGIIGAGMIGKYVIKLLKNYKMNILVFDPFLADKDAEEMGVKKVSLEEIFTECDVVSNHLANNEQTKDMLTYELFLKMKPYSTFINTGRPNQVEEEGFIRFLKQRPDVTALLDVFWNEQSEEDHPLHHVDNCFITPHTAGAYKNEYWRLSEYMTEEFKRFINGEPCKYEVTEQMLKTMA